MKKENFSEDIDNLFKSKSITPIQKVVPIEKNKKFKNQTGKPKDEKQVSFEIEKKLLNRLKIRAIEEDLNFKGIMTAAIQKYLE